MKFYQFFLIIHLYCIDNNLKKMIDTFSVMMCEFTRDDEMSCVKSREQKENLFLKRVQKN